MHLCSALSHAAFPVNISQWAVLGESPDCLLLSGTAVGENLDHARWVKLNRVMLGLKGFYLSILANIGQSS